MPEALRVQSDIPLASFSHPICTWHQYLLITYVELILVQPSGCVTYDVYQSIAVLRYTWLFVYIWQH
jgi:hypothetical protein